MSKVTEVGKNEWWRTKKPTTIRLAICGWCGESGGTLKFAGRRPQDGLEVYVHDPRVEGKVNRECKRRMLTRALAQIEEEKKAYVAGLGSVAVDAGTTGEVEGGPGGGRVADPAEGDHNSGVGEDDDGRDPDADRGPGGVEDDSDDRIDERNYRSPLGE